MSVHWTGSGALDRPRPTPLECDPELRNHLFELVELAERTSELRAWMPDYQKRLEAIEVELSDVRRRIQMMMQGRTANVQ